MTDFDKEGMKSLNRSLSPGSGHKDDLEGMLSDPSTKIVRSSSKHGDTWTIFHMDDQGTTGATVHLIHPYTPEPAFPGKKKPEKELPGVITYAGTTLEKPEGLFKHLVKGALWMSSQNIGRTPDAYEPDESQSEGALKVIDDMNRDAPVMKKVQTRATNTVTKEKGAEWAIGAIDSARNSLRMDTGTSEEVTPEQLADGRSRFDHFHDALNQAQSSEQDRSSS